MGVATDGSVFFPQVVTSAEPEELPTELRFGATVRTRSIRPRRFNSICL